MWWLKHRPEPPAERGPLRTRPTWEPLTLGCECGCEWQDWQPLNVPFETWEAHMRQLACPACGTGHGRLEGKTLGKTGRTP